MCAKRASPDQPAKQKGGPSAQKTANLLVDDSVAGTLTCYVCDLGLAAEMGAGGVVVSAECGTPGYMCPLLAAGVRAVTPATDVFAWGRLLRALAQLGEPADGPLPVRLTHLCGIG